MLSIQLTVKDMPFSQALEAHIRKKAEKIKQFHKHIISCRMTVGLTQKHKHQGKLYYIVLDTTVPKKIFVTRKQNEDVYIAIRDGLKALERQLETHASQHHGHAKIRCYQRDE